MRLSGRDPELVGFHFEPDGLVIDASGVEPAFDRPRTASQKEADHVSTSKAQIGTLKEANRYLVAEHLSATRWLALPELATDGEGTWQDVSLRPELCCEAPPVGDPGSPSPGLRGFTVEICTSEVLEEDFENGAGPHPRELLPAGEEAALDVERMAVYLARPFTLTEALAYAELLLLEAGVPVASLEEVERDTFYGGLAGRIS